MSNFEKKYNFNFEKDIYSLWINEYNKNQTSNENDYFVMMMPPPNVTGVLHLGHALMLSIEDAIVRYKKLKGKRVIWIPGTDHAGIATQVVVEKKLLEKGLKRQDLGREKFLKEVWEWVNYSRNTIIEQIKILGSYCDRSRENFTLSEKLSRSVRKAFKLLYNKGKIYKDNYIVNRCPHDKTVLSDLEVDYKKEKGKLYYIRYFIEGKDNFLVVATTRPETIFADVALAVNPKDKRYKKLIGKNVLIPIVNRPIPIIGDEYVDPYFGTGVLKITPTHDPNDFIIGKKHNLDLTKFAIDLDGKFTSLAPDFLVGKEVEKYFDNLIQVLDEIGNLEKIEDYDHNVPYCQRCGTKIQPMLSKQWFLDVKEYADKAIEAVKKGDIKIYPNRFEKIYFDWLENIRPWCISRQLWRGHTIPVWECLEGHVNVFDDEYIFKADTDKYKILTALIFNLIADKRLKNPFNIEELIDLLFSKSYFSKTVLDEYIDIFKNYDEINILLKIRENSEMLVDILENSYLIEKNGDKYRLSLKCQFCGKEVYQEENVLDTWFSSALWPFSTLGWPEETEDFKLFFPNDLLETGYDILFFWVARMIMMSYALTGTYPFKEIYLHGLVRDEKGEKMSKSKGNVIDPLDVIEKYGTDVLRLTLVKNVTPGNDVKFSWDKADGNYKFLNKLWNASRYVYMNSKRINYDDIKLNFDKLNNFDKWIISEFSKLNKKITTYMDKYMLGQAVEEIYLFIWEKFCDWYIELTKIYTNDNTEVVLNYILSNILILLHPFAPYITEKIWQNFNYGGLLIEKKYPDINYIYEDKDIELIFNLINYMRKYISGLSLNKKDKIELIFDYDSKLFIEKYKEIFKLINIYDIKFSKIDNYDIKIENIILNINIEKEKDIEYYIEKITKEIKEEEEFAQTLRNILSNQNFLQNAPSEVVQQKKNKLKEVEEKIKNLKNQLNKYKMLKSNK